MLTRGNTAAWWLARGGRMLLVLVAILGAAPAAAGGATPILAFDSPGGEAWTFDKRVAGTVLDGSCDEVVVISPEGEAPARRDGGRFVATVALDAGVNEVRAVCRDDGAVRGTSPPQRWTVRLPDVPKARVRLDTRDGGLALDGGASETAPARAAPLVRWEWRARPGNPAPLHAAGIDKPLDAAPASGERLRLRMPSADGDYYVTLRVVDALGRADESTTVFRVRGGRARPVDLAREHPAWIDDAVVYGVVPSLFGPRGLADVTERLDDIAALGVTVLWLAPVTDSPEGDFGYAVTDPFRVRPSLGSEADLAALVAAAHARGLRVILDFVANHLSDQSPYYVDVLRNGDASAYRDFFDRDGTGKVTHYFDWTDLENLNYANPEVQRYVIEAAKHWVRDLHVDGFRVDASWGVRERAPGFWPRWRAELKRIDPDLLLIAEASARDPYYARHGFDAAYDWTDRLGEWAWRDAFAPGAPTAARLRAALTNEGRGRDPATLVFRFLDNNDTGPRFVTRHGVARTRVAATMLLTLPGLPCLYTGEAVGAAFLPYAEPAPLDWRDRYGLFDHYARLARLRHAEPALRSRALELVDASPDDTVLAYLRPAPVPEDGVLVLLNYGGAPVTATLAPAPDLVPLLEGPLVDLLTGETLAVDPAAPAVALPAFGALVLRRSSAG